MNLSVNSNLVIKMRLFVKIFNLQVWSQSLCMVTFISRDLERGYIHFETFGHFGNFRVRIFIFICKIVNNIFFKLYKLYESNNDTYVGCMLVKHTWHLFVNFRHGSRNVHAFGSYFLVVVWVGCFVLFLFLLNLLISLQ